MAGYAVGARGILTPPCIFYNVYYGELLVRHTGRCETDVTVHRLRPGWVVGLSNQFYTNHAGENYEGAHSRGR